MGKLRTAIKKDFTVVHNEFIRDERVGIEEMGMLVFLLSLPDSWNFSIEGLTKVLPNGKHKIMTTLNKLKELGYFRRIRQVDDRGRVIDWVYEFSDECHPEWLTDEEESEVITPHSDNRDMDKSDMENQPQSNIIESNKNNDYDLRQLDESRKDKYISYTSKIRDNINYNELKKSEDSKTVDRIIDIMVNTIISEKEKIRINKKEIKLDELTADLMSVSEADVRQIIAAIKGKSIRCFEKYVLAALTNAVANKSEPKPVEFQVYSTDTLDFYADACDYSFNDEEMQYIETMLIRIVPTTVGRNTEIELERFNYLRSKYLFMQAQNSRRKINNKFGYIKKMIGEEMA